MTGYHHRISRDSYTPDGTLGKRQRDRNASLVVTRSKGLVSCSIRYGCKDTRTTRIDIKILLLGLLHEDVRLDLIDHCARLFHVEFCVVVVVSGSRFC